MYPSFRGLRVIIGTLATSLVAPTFLQAAPGQTVESEHGMVASVHSLASQVGVDILKQGGNAVDAAVAVGFALEVVYPYAGNLGGGGFSTIHLANGKNVFIDFRETAPAAATRNMYLGKDGNPLPLKDPQGYFIGWRASGVPGSVAGFALALERYGSGKFTWAQLIEPARKLAAEGHVVTAFNANLFKRLAPTLAQYEDSKRIYLNGGALWKEGDLFKQPDLAATLERLQKNGPSEFYEGETAHKIADAMAAHGGTISYEDLKHYKAVERAPLIGHYRGYDVITAPPPSSGGIVIMQMLGMIQPFDVNKLGVNSPARHHLFIEAMRRGYRDRAAYMGDPDFVKVPTEGLLDPDYLTGLMKSFDPNRATPSAGLQPGKPKGWEAIAALEAEAGPKKVKESHETTQYSIIDADGNAVSTTYTLNGPFGSCVTIPGTGLLMNDEMGDFAAKPGVPNAFGLIQGEADAIVPGKRPLSSMSPSVILKDGRIFFVTGSPGGSMIIDTVFEVITNVIDFHMSMADAVAAPRFYHQWMPDTVTMESGIPEPVLQGLEAMGHKLTARGPGPVTVAADAESIMVDPLTGHRIGVSDPRKPDARPIGY